MMCVWHISGTAVARVRIHEYMYTYIHTRRRYYTEI